ncbi:hypothetical protein CHU98_g233 [Xylaria longipes]|nr:hypothetical protein CHU98_g233 [Xylaria longipes]
MDGNAMRPDFPTNSIGGNESNFQPSPMDGAVNTNGVQATGSTKDTTQASAEQADVNANSGAYSVFSETRHGIATPLQSQVMDVGPDASFLGLTGVQSEGEGQHSATHIKDEDVDHNPTIFFFLNPNTQASQHPNIPPTISKAVRSFEPDNNDSKMDLGDVVGVLDDEESLFVPGDSSIGSPQPARVHGPESDKLNNPNSLWVPEANDEAISEPIAMSFEGSSSRLLENTEDVWPQVTESNHYSSDLPPSHASDGVEQDYLTAPINDAESPREGEVEISAKSTKRKRSGVKTGPRAKSAREWFAKRSKDLQPSLPMIAGIKRKRSKKTREDGTSSSKKRKRSKKIAADKGGKKTRPNKKSIKVMAALFENLRHSNPIEARIALGDLPQADPIIATTKGNQFQQIMKGLPKSRSITADKKKLEEATRSFGLKKCVPKNGKWLIKGMKTTLLNHQVIGTSWMLGREFCEEGPWGGILGDEMGMGKTLQALGCIVSNRPGRKDLKTHSKTTLIVAPATAIEQWKDEIQKHTDRKYIGTVFHFKQSANLELETLKTFGIILASYQEVSSQFPSKKLRAQLQNDGGSVEEWKERFDDNLGLLFKIPFWRVILDEAHHIKNKDSQMSVACQNLPGRHRWGMSGTPITNCLDVSEGRLGGRPTRFSLPLRKLRRRDRLAVVMDILMLRRTMATTFMGRPLYDIPMCHMSVRRVQLTKEERVIYKKSGRRVRLRDLEIYIVFLLRLRQGAAHPILLEPVFKNTLRKYDLLEIKRRLREVGGKVPLFQQIGKWCAKKATVLENTEKQDDEVSRDAFGSSQFGYDLNIDRQVDIAIASKNEDVCRLCYQELIDGYIAKCEHLFCKECLDDHILEERRGGRVIPKCPDCNKSLTEYEPLEQSDAEDSDIEGSVKTSGSRRAIPQVRKLGRDSFKKHPKFRKSHSRFLQECDQAYPKPAVPSAKTIAVREAIIKWQSEAPDDKIIVFVEFKMTGAILGRMLEAEGIEFLYFFGDMTSAEKQNAIRGFHNKKNIKVLVASFRCGSVALNLTCANRVILVDLWWNISIELQAFARVFRIGQTKETYFLRIIAHNTIDDRIEALQEEKIKNINTVLGPGEKSKLSTEEVAALFGHLKKFDDGSFEIVPDNEGDAELNEEFDEIEEAEEAEEI